MSGYLLDTWAWIEFYEGSRTGEKVYKLINRNGPACTLVVSLAELSDNYQRGNLVTDHPWKQIRAFVEANTDIISITPETASRAGKIKQSERESQPDFGLVDALILATAREHNLKLLTGDPHLNSKEEAVDLEKGGI